MKLTTRGRFAVTAMADLALYADGSPISIAQVSERQHISLPYLEQIFCRLRRAGLVESTRGPGGGYKLSRAAEEMTVAEIISAVDENMDTTQCGGEGTCQGGVACITHHLWQDLNGVIDRFLEGVTLAQLVKSSTHHRHHHTQVVSAKIPTTNRHSSVTASEN